MSGNRFDDLGNDGYENKKKSPKGLIGVIVAIVALVLVAVAGFWFATSNGDSAAPPPAPAVGVQTREAAPTQTPPAATPTATPTAGQCTTATQGFKPTELRIDAMDVTSQVQSVSYDADGNPGVPDPNDSQGTAWFNGSMAPGSPSGVSMLNIHTYRNGGALGNALLTDLPNDALLKVRDGDTVACYQVYDRVKIWVDDYDPNGPQADRLYDQNGDANVAIVVCDDFNWDTENWDSRVIWYAKKVA